MEFKSIEKWRVQRDLNLTEVQLDEIIKRAGRRHPMEDWIYLRVAGNGGVIETGICLLVERSLFQ